MLRFEAIPDVPVPPQHFMLRSGEGIATETVGRSNARDAVLIAPHGHTITHLDAPSHTFVRADADAPWMERGTESPVNPLAVL